MSGMSNHCLRSVVLTLEQGYLCLSAFLKDCTRINACYSQAVAIYSSVFENHTVRPLYDNPYVVPAFRSYRKPPTAELLADLDNTRYGHHNHNRPKTAASQLSSRRLLVPQPFIYR